jgi:hypothetical protein
MCKTFINLHKTKLSAVETSIERGLNEINHEDIHLVCEYVAVNSKKSGNY